MRCTIVLKPLNKKLHEHANMTFVSIIKEAIKAYDKEYYEELYLDDERKGKNRRLKDFTFSYYINERTFSNGYIECNSDILLNISTAKLDMFMAIYNGFTLKKKYHYKGLDFKVEAIYKKKEHRITSNTVVLKTMSPMAIKNKNGHFLNLEDEQFTENINYIANNLVTMATGSGLRTELVFRPLSMKKVVVKQVIQDYKNGEEPFCVNAFKGIYELTGDSEDLNILLKTGLSFLRSQGFGMCEKVM